MIKGLNITLITIILKYVIVQKMEHRISDGEGQMWIVEI